MERCKPPDPPDKPPDPPKTPEPFEYTPRLVVTLPQDTAMDVESNSNRKRSAVSPPPTAKNVKVSKNIGRRLCYKPTDFPPYIVHVSLKEDQPTGTTLHPIKFGQFLNRHNFRNICMDGIKRIGRNRISVQFKSYEDANSFLVSDLMAKHNYVTSIPQFHITRMGIIQRRSYRGISRINYTGPPDWKGPQATQPSKNS